MWREMGRVWHTDSKVYGEASLGLCSEQICGIRERGSVLVFLFIFKVIIQTQPKKSRRSTVCANTEMHTYTVARVRGRCYVCKRRRVFLDLLWVRIYSICIRTYMYTVPTFLPMRARGICCQRWTLLMLIFLPLWQLRWTLQSSQSNTKNHHLSCLSLAVLLLSLLKTLPLWVITFHTVYLMLIWIQ